MHIPDGVLSPATSITTTVVMLPVWAIAGRQVRRSLGTRQVPLLALGAALCFTIMLFNIPVYGGTTVHPVAGTLLAVLLGPWAALIGVSVSLAIQALFFGDGGLLTYGANCFTMAFVLPFVGYSVYRLIAGRAFAASPRRAMAAAIGAYVGLNAAAAVVAVLLGIQPALFHAANGQALYFPFGLKLTLPIMLGAHLLAAGPAEAIVTGLVVRYLQVAGHAFYGCPPAGEESAARLDSRPRRERLEALWIGLLALVAMSPLGLLAQGDAWGEWDAKGVQEQIARVEGKAYVPLGLSQAERHGYKGIPALRDYAQPEEGRNSLSYIGSAVLGVGVIAGLLLLVGRLFKTEGEKGRRGEGETKTPIVDQSLLSSTTQNTSGRSENGISPSPSPLLPFSPSHTRSDQHEMEEDNNNVSPSPLLPFSPSALPEWLLQPSAATAPEPDTLSRPSNRFVERTLAGLAEGAATTLRGERWARQPGYLQQLDSRAKLIGFLALIVIASCLHTFACLLALFLLVVGLTLASRLPLGAMMRRVWLSVPLFTGAIALPQALNTVTPGQALLVLSHHPYLSITAPGMASASLLTLRVGVAVSLGALLTLTTGWNDLLHALRALLAPRLFVTVLAMTYRYVALLSQTASEMFVARRSRTVGHTTNAQSRRFVGRAVGAMFTKTFALSEEVHAAMLSRGFNGEIHTIARPNWRAADTAWTLFVAIIAVITLGSEITHVIH